MMLVVPPGTAFDPQCVITLPPLLLERPETRAFKSVTLFTTAFHQSAVNTEPDAAVGIEAFHAENETAAKPATDNAQMEKSAQFFKLFHAAIVAMRNENTKSDVRILSINR